MRRFVIGLIALLAVVGLAATAALVLRKPLAGHVAQRVLAERGYPEASVRFEILNAEEAVITGLTLGPGRPLAVDRVHVAYDPMKLAAGDLRHLSLSVRGVEAELDFTAPEGAFTALLGRPAGPGRETDKQEPDEPRESEARQPLAFHELPEIAIEDARIVAITAEGRATIEATAHLAAAAAPGELPRLTATGRIESEDVPVAGSFDAGLVEGELDAEFDISSGRGLTATFALKGRDLLATPGLDLQARAKVPAEDRFAWDVLGLPPPQGGVARIDAAFAGNLESLDPPAGLAEAVTQLGKGGWNGRAAFELDGLTFPQLADGLQAAGAARLSFQDHGVRIAIAEPWTFGLDKVAEPLLARLGLPAEASAYLSEPVNATLALPEDGALTATLKNNAQDIVLEGTPEVVLVWAERSSRARLRSRMELTLAADGAPRRFQFNDIDASIQDFSHPLASLSELALSGSLSGRSVKEMEAALDLSLELSEAAAEGYRLTGVSATLPLDIRLSDEEGQEEAQEEAQKEAHVATRAEGRLRVEGCRIPGSARILCPLEISVADAWLDLEGETPRYGVEATLSKVDLRLPRQDDTPLDFSLTPAQISAEGTLAVALPERVRAQGFDVALAGYRLAAEGVDIELTPGTADNFARFGIARFAHRGEPSFLAPIRIEGKVERQDEAFAVEARGTAAGERAEFSVNGRIAGSGESGRASFSLPALTFQPGALQPADLAPALAALEKVAGSAQLGAEGRWSSEGVDGQADIEISGMDFTTAGIRVEGVEGTLHLSDLVPLAAPNDQTFRIDTIDAGLPIRNATARFGLATPPGETPVVQIADARGEILGGFVRVSDWTFDPLAERQNVTISVDGLKLAELFQTIDIQGLSGRGTISGSVPITLSSQGVAIAEGSLEAKEDGALSFQSKEADQVLSKSGEQVDLMLRALKDFRYDELSLTLDKPMQGEAALKISMLGHNPDVLDGYPFRFNITLSGDLEPILAAVAKGRRLSSELLQRSLRLR